ncbi:FxDxF family PEP-CTERM protein [Qipengyuania sp.]|uniref:FxDxF family PEP-CTERM protein n=1 Tax=Qipengyuania sp. TaxID=2004515 RepID=UPI0035C7B2C4
MKTFFASSFIAAALCTAGAAQAATTVTYDEGPEVDLTASADGSTYSGIFGATIGGEGDFTTEFFFDVPVAGTVSIAGITILSDAASNLTFTDGLLNGTTPFTITNGTIDVAQLFLKPIAAGRNTFTLNGTFSPATVDGVGGLGGNVSFSVGGAVPEPATWGLFILGFGAIGGVMRRQARSNTAARGRIKFA